MTVADLPSAVEAELARLRAENARLLKLLKLTPKQAAPARPRAGRLLRGPSRTRASQVAGGRQGGVFGSLFAARTDVYAVRFDNQRTGKSGWVPAVRGGWQKGVRREDRSYLPLTPAVLASHLRGEVHVGLYPLLDGGDLIRAQARFSRSACWPGTQVPARRSRAACQPGKRTASLLSVYKHVDDLCATAPSLCTHGGNAGDYAAWPQP